MTSSTRQLTLFINEISNLGKMLFWALSLFFSFIFCSLDSKTNQNIYCKLTQGAQKLRSKSKKISNGKWSNPVEEFTFRIEDVEKPLIIEMYLSFSFHFEGGLKFVNVYEKIYAKNGGKRSTDWDIDDGYERTVCRPQ